MAIRFGGPFSPAQRGPDGRPLPVVARHPKASRTTWIIVAASPFLIGAFFQDPTVMAMNLAGFGILGAGMWLTREGLQAEAEYDARRVARRPALPRKLFGGVLTGLGLAVGAAEPGALAGAGVIGVVGALLHWFSFGPDPMRDKGMQDIDRFQQDRVARVVEEGDAYLAQMHDAVLRTGDRQLEAQVAAFAATARDLFRRVEEDPGELAAARRYLGVYLMGARDATVRFADLYAQTRDRNARAAWEALMADLQTNFAARSRSLIEGGRTDMEIEIGVLRDRLAREGVRSEDVPPAGQPQLEQSREQRFDDLLRDTGLAEDRLKEPR